jgi:hypothetical protein
MEKSKKKEKGGSSNTSENKSLSITHHVNFNASTGLIMLLDGIGLAIIAGSTLLEGFDLWKDFFNEYWLSNASSLSFWFSGRTCQIIGLIILIAHAASFQVFHEVERYGMFMLTIGPILNLFSCSSFDSGMDSSYLYNKTWCTTELIELLGIVILDISLIEMNEFWVFISEVTGFFFLCCAAVVEVEYSSDGQTYPKIGFRLDLIHTSECFGLILLTIVAFVQYRIKQYKIEHHLDKNHHHQNITHHDHNINNIQNIHANSANTNQYHINSQNNHLVNQNIQNSVKTFNNGNIAIQNPQNYDAENIQKNIQKNINNNVNVLSLQNNNLGRQELNSKNQYNPIYLKNYDDDGKKISININNIVTVINKNTLVNEVAADVTENSNKSNSLNYKTSMNFDSNVTIIV